MIELKSLSNGVRVVLEELPYVRSIAFGIYVKNGSSNETEQEEGISHFIEHMVFKGTATRSSKQIAEDMDELGGQINAYTTKEYTCYHFRTLDKHFGRALDILSDMFLNSKFDEKDIQKERNVIIEEINMYDDDPEERVQDILQNIIWNGSSLAHPILGTEETISNFNSNKIKEYFKSHYRNDNTVISAVGNFKTEEMLEKLERVFGGWKTGRHDTIMPETPVYNSGFSSEEKDTEQLHLCITFPSFRRDHEMKYPYAVLNTVFGGGMSSMLFQKVREENGLSYTIYSFPTSYEKTGSFTIYTALNPSQAESVCTIVKECICDIKTGGISDTLLNKTKTQLISGFIIGNESTLSRMTSNGVSVLMLGYAKEQEETIKEAEKASAADVKFAAESIFNFDLISIAACGNTKEIDSEKLINIFRKNS
ncbi:insulinase family protein [Lachnospiraceae bacterium NSJ-143]|nr:insulinase family protein [Lachnospiraceae bacterium NSJ-143]